MTTFEDGPARGQHLGLRRAPFVIRVTEKDGAFDALDQADDEPFPGEKLFAYVQVGYPTVCHMRIAKPGRSGFYAIATYRLIDPQPVDAEMRENEAWTKWCHANADRLGWQRWKEGAPR